MNKSISSLNTSDFLDAPDLRDGLNPALRMLFFAWNEAIQDDRFKNSSRLLTDVIGVSENAFDELYDLLVDNTYPRIACDLSFVIGHGNFGFPPAHPYFSEMKLTDFAKAIIERGNPDDLNLPFTVPIPYTLVCGVMGYSMSETKIPTHNLAEAIDAMVALVKNPNLETKDLLRYIKGPDLLIGGAIENPEELCDIYEKGFGTVKIIVTSQNFNWNRFERVGEYCKWYELKLRKVYKKDAYRIALPYYALMYDGERNELMSLKSILQKHLNYYRAYKSDLSDEQFCDMLISLKEYSSKRLTQEKLCDEI